MTSSPPLGGREGAAAVAGSSPPRDGFLVVSRWGAVQHRAGCTCKPCARQRRAGGAASRAEAASRPLPSPAAALPLPLPARARSPSPSPLPPPKVARLSPPLPTVVTSAPPQRNRAVPLRAAAPRCLVESSPEGDDPLPARVPAPLAEAPAEAAEEEEEAARSRSPTPGWAGSGGARGRAARAGASAAPAPGLVTVRQLLRAGGLEGRSVEYRSRAGKMLLAGRVTGEGLIAVPGGAGQSRLCSASEFEAAAGSRERRPGACIYLSNGASLRDIAAAITAAGAAAGARHALREQPAASQPPPRAGLEPERDVGKHGRLFMPGGGLTEGARVAYCTAQGETLASGIVRLAAAGGGIQCLCCEALLSASGFEAHAGRASRRAPYDNILLLPARLPLRDVAAAIAPPPLPGQADPPAAGQREAYVAPAPARHRGPARAAEAAAAAAELATLAAACLVPLEGEEEDGQAPFFGPTAWRGGPALSEAPEQGVPGPPPPGPLLSLALTTRRLLAELDAAAGGCCLCACADFERPGGEGPVLGPRTMLLCDTCEREFHLGCLEAAGRGRLATLPAGDWFCGHGCAAVAAALAAAVAAGPQPMPGQPRYSLTLLRGPPRGDAPDAAARKADQVAVEAVLRDAFDPITDPESGRDLLPLMARSARPARGCEHDFGGMHSLLLRHGGVPVCAALLRSFGTACAELPLIATPEAQRRRGHCAVLMTELQRLLAGWGVRRLALPAAAAAEGMWREVHGFRPLPPLQLRLARAQLRLLVFPGATLLHKELVGQEVDV